MIIQSLEELFLTSLQYVYDGEKQLTEALPRLAEASKNPQLKAAFEAHLKETKEHVRRSEDIFRAFGHEPSTKSNRVMEAMWKEADGMVMSIDAGPILDAALVEAANQVEHWEMAAYISLGNYAKLLGKQDVVEMLEDTLAEEKAAAVKVTEVGHTISKQLPQHAVAGAR